MHASARIGTYKAAHFAELRYKNDDPVRECLEKDICLDALKFSD